MNRLHRRTAAACVVAVVLLAGCGGPTQAGAAALVGDDRISVDTLRDLTARSLADEAAAQRFGEDRPAFIRRELGLLIRRELLQRLADKLGVEVTQGEVDERLRAFSEQSGGRAELEKQAAASGVAPGDLQLAVQDLLLQQKIGDALVADEPVDPALLRSAYEQQIDQFDQVHAAHILVANRALAERILGQVRATPSSFAALAKEHSVDTSNKDRGGDLGYAGRGQFVKPFSDAIFAAKENTYVLAQTEFGFHVIHVIDRRTRSLAEATPDLRRALLQDKAEEAVTAALVDIEREHEVKVSPRYGRFDAASGEVAAPKDELARPRRGPEPTPTPVESAAPTGP